jgi:hypothetical protein
MIICIFFKDVNPQSESEGTSLSNKRSLEELANERQAKIVRYRRMKEQEIQIKVNMPFLFHFYLILFNQEGFFI